MILGNHVYNDLLIKRRITKVAEQLKRYIDGTTGYLILYFFEALMPRNDNIGKKILDRAAVAGATAVLKETFGDSVEHYANEATSAAMALNESLDLVGDSVAETLGNGIGDAAGAAFDVAGDVVEGVVTILSTVVEAACSIL